MRDKDANNLPWGSMLSGVIHDAAMAVTKLVWWEWVLGVAVVVAAIMCVPTVAEFIVALHNRYSVYPSDTYETSMLAKSIGLTGVLSLCAAFLVGYIFKIVPTKWYVTVLCLLLSGLVCMVDWGTMPQVMGIVALVVFGVTIGLSIWAKIPFLIPLIAFLIMLAARPSFLPADWCKYELTMYPCQPAQGTDYIHMQQFR